MASGDGQSHVERDMDLPGHPTALLGHMNQWGCHGFSPVRGRKGLVFRVLSIQTH